MLFCLCPRVVTLPPSIHYSLYFLSPRLSELGVTCSVISNHHSVCSFNISLLSIAHSQLQCVLIKATVINGVHAYLCEGFKDICKSYPCILNEFRMNSITF